MKKKKAAITVVSAIIFGLLTLILIGYLFSQRLSVESYVESGDVTICHLSDLHLPKNGVSTEEILAACRSASPDLIFLTGDMFDGSADENDLRSLSEFYFELRKIAPVYAVVGNHEIGSELYESYVAACKDNGVSLLLNETLLTTVKNRPFLITGLKDGSLFSEKNLPDYALIREENQSAVNLLLAHRPENFDNYAEGDFDAVFCGHAHGGQARLFGRGLYAPNQGLFPSYTSGRYSSGNSLMFVSRGLGDSYSAFRFFNSYNIIFVTL